MTITFNIPATVEEALARAGSDPAAVLKEAALVELYRQGRLSHGQLAEGLGTSRPGADAVLRRHNVTEDLLTPAELDAQVAEFRGLIGG